MGFATALMGGLSVAKGIVGAAGAVQSSEASAANYMVQAQIAMNNAVIAAQQAEQETRVGEYKVAQTGLMGAAKYGTTVAHQAKGGVDVNSGSNLKVQEAVTRAGVQDTKTAESDMARKVYGYQVQSTNFVNQAAMNARGAQSAKNAGTLGMISSLLDGASGAAGSVGKYFFGGGGGGGDMSVENATSMYPDLNLGSASG